MISHFFKIRLPDAECHKRVLSERGYCCFFFCDLDHVRRHGPQFHVVCVKGLVVKVPSFMHFGLDTTLPISVVFDHQQALVFWAPCQDSLRVLFRDELVGTCSLLDFRLPAQKVVNVCCHVVQPPCGWLVAACSDHESLLYDLIELHALQVPGELCSCLVSEPAVISWRAVCFLSFLRYLVSTLFIMVITLCLLEPSSMNLLHNLMQPS